MLIGISLNFMVLVLSGVFVLSCYGEDRTIGGESRFPQEKISAVDACPEEVSEVWGNETGGLIASLNADKTLFHPEEPILVRFQIKNISDRPQTVWHSGFWPNHRLIVKDSKGDNVPLTALGEQTRAVFGSDTLRRKNFAVTLAPGKIDTPYGPYDLRNYFQIGDSATLRVRCLYLHGSVEVFSNELVLNVK